VEERGEERERMTGREKRERIKEGLAKSPKLREKKLMR